MNILTIILLILLAVILFKVGFALLRFVLWILENFNVLSAYIR